MDADEVAERRKLMYEAAMARQTRAQERGMPRLRKEREAREARARAELLRLPPELLYDRLGPNDKWREHIDGRHHHYGKNVYVKGRHGRKPDPNYNTAMMEADRFIRSRIGKGFTAKDYRDLHFLTLPNKDDLGRFPRQGPLPIRFAGFKSRISTLAKENTSPKGTGLPPLVKGFDRNSTYDVTGNIRGDHVVLAGIKNPETAVEKILQAYHKRISDASTPDEKLGIIVETHKALENLHPYIDANTRTNRLVLNKMLAENQLPLTMLDNPLEVHHTDLKAWKASIQKGQDRWVKEATSPDRNPGDWQRWYTSEALERKYMQNETLRSEGRILPVKELERLRKSEKSDREIWQFKETMRLLDQNPQKIPESGDTKDQGRNSSSSIPDDLEQRLKNLRL